MGDRLWRTARLAIVAFGAVLIGWLLFFRQPSPPPSDPPPDATSDVASDRPRIKTAPARPVTIVDNPGKTSFEDAFQRVEFDAERVRFSVPAGPAGDPHTLALKTRRMTIGGSVLYDADAADPAAPHRNKKRVIYPLASGIVERYDVETRRVEQSWDLPARPGQGDLVIDVAVEGSLAPRLHEAPPHRPFDIGQLLAHNWTVDYIDADGRPVVALGKAWAWDAKSDTVPVEVALADGGYRLRVDGVWLAGATYPVTVDPPFLIVNSTAGDATAATGGHGHTALAYNNGGGAGNNTFMLVINYQESGDDWDIEWAPLNADGAFAGPIRSATATEPTSVADMWPDIDYSPTSNSFLIAWLRERDVFVDDILTKVMGIRVDSTGAPIAAPAGAITPLGNPNTFLIRDIAVDAPAPPPPGINEVGHLLPTSPTQGPKVAWNSVNNRYLVAWRDGEGGGNVCGSPCGRPNRTHGARGRFIRAADGTLDPGFSIIALGATSNVTSLDLEWNPIAEGGMYMMVLTRTLGTNCDAATPPTNCTTWEEDLFLNAMSADCDTDGTAGGFTPLAGANLVNQRQTYNSESIAVFTSNSTDTNLAKNPPDPRSRIAVNTNPLHPMWLAAWEDQRAGATGGSEIRAIGAAFAFNPANPPPDNVAARVLLPDFEYLDSSRLDRHPAVAWDSFRDDFLVAAHSLTVGTVADIVGRRMDFGGDFLDGLTPGAPFNVSNPATNLMAIRPSAAFNSVTQRFLVTFIAGNNTQFFGTDDDTFGALISPPAAPTGLTHTFNTANSITWQWTDNSAAPDNESEFRIKDGPLTMATAAAGAVNVTETGLAENTRTARTAVAVNEFGESASSNVHQAFSSVANPQPANFALTQLPPADPLCGTQLTIDPVEPPNACAAHRRVAHIPALGRPKGIASGVIGAGARVFLALADVPWIYVIDPATDQIVARYDSRMGGNPPANMANGMALDVAGGIRKLFLVGSGGIQVLDADTGALIQGGICAGVAPFGIAAAPAADRVFIAGSASNTVHTYSTDTLTAVNHLCTVNLAAAPGCPPTDPPCSPSTGGQFRQGEEPSLVAAVSTRGFGTYRNHDGLGGAGSISAAGVVTGWTDTSNGAFGIAAHEGRNRVYVGHRGSNVVSVFDLTGGGFAPLAAAQFTLPAVEAFALAIDEPSNRLFVINDGNNLRVYNIATDIPVFETTFVVDQMQNATEDGGQFMTALNGKVYIPSFQASRYSVIDTFAGCTGAKVRIERSIGPGGPFALIPYPAPLVPDADGFIDSFAPIVDNDGGAGLQSGTQYCYRILYKNGDGDQTAASQSSCLTTCALDLIVGGCPGGVADPAVDPVCSLPNGTEGGGYSQTITAIGGVKPYFWTPTPTSNPFPFQFTVSGNNITVGIATGAPAGTFTFDLLASDSQNPADIDTRRFSITISGGTPGQPPEINDPGTITGTFGQPFGGQLIATGGQPPYTWSILSGTLPDGVVLNNDGSLGGTPRCVGTRVVCVQVSTENGAFTDTTPNPPCLAGEPLTVTIAPNQVSITTLNLPDGQVSTAYNQSINSTGGVGSYTWTSNPNPPIPGTAFGAGSPSESGLLSGIPTTVGTFTFTATINDTGQADCAGGQAVVSASTQFSVTIQPQGGQLTITTTGVPNGTVNVAYPAFTLTAIGGTTPYVWSVVSGLPPGLALNPNGTLAGTPTQAGTFQLVVSVTDSGSPQQTVQGTFSVVISGPPVITTASPLPNAVQGQGYSTTLTATGGTTPYSWSVVGGTLTGTVWTGGGLPAGIELSALSGTISGTTALAGTFNFSITVTDNTGATDTDPFSLSVIVNQPATCPPGPAVVTNTLPSGQVNGPYAATLTATGGQTAPNPPPPYTWSVSPTSPTPLATLTALGLTLSPTGNLSGTPNATTSLSVQFRVTDAGGCAADSVAMTLTIIAPLSILTNSPLPNGGLNLDYSQTLTATGGTPGYTWGILSGNLPNGLSLSAAGVISGQPTTAGTTVFFVRVTDSQGAQAQKQFSITIQQAVAVPPPPRPAPASREAGFCFAGESGRGSAWTAIACALLLAVASALALRRRKTGR